MIQRQTKDKTVTRRVGRPSKNPLQRQMTAQSKIYQKKIPKCRRRLTESVSRHTASCFKSREKMRKSPRLEPLEAGKQPCDSNEWPTSSKKGTKVE